MWEVHLTHPLAALRDQSAMLQLNKPEMGPKVFEIDGADSA
jgi:hypothetical protein